MIWAWILTVSAVSGWAVAFVMYWEWRRALKEWKASDKGWQDALDRNEAIEKLLTDFADTGSL